jgi:hypothetical protein
MNGGKGKLTKGYNCDQKSRELLECPKNVSANQLKYENFPEELINVSH